MIFSKGDMLGKVFFREKCRIMAEHKAKVMFYTALVIQICVLGFDTFMLCQGAPLIWAFVASVPSYCISSLIQTLELVENY